MPARDRVVIVGTGLVGATTAYALLRAGTVADLVLIDRDRRKLEGHVHDLRDAALFSPATQVRAGEIADCADATAIVITAGIQQAGLKSRLDDLHQSAAIVRELVTEIVRVQPGGVLLLASNPV